MGGRGRKARGLEAGPHQVAGGDDSATVELAYLTSHPRIRVDKRLLEVELHHFHLVTAVPYMNIFQRAVVYMLSSGRWGL